MAGRTTHGGKGDRDRVADREAFENNFDVAFPNAFVPSWKRRRQMPHDAGGAAPEPRPDHAG